MCSDILISLLPQHCDNVVAGIKTVELRRRKPNVPPGTRVWIYTKRPRACIAAVAVIEAIYEGSHNELWKRFGHRVAISRPDFDEYLAGSNRGYAIVLRSASSLYRLSAVPIEIMNLFADWRNSKLETRNSELENRNSIITQLPARRTLPRIGYRRDSV